MNEILNLFDENFYFLTNYPQLVPEIELKEFLLNNTKTYKILFENKIIGLAFYREINEGYIFFRFKINSKFLNLVSSQKILDQFLNIIINSKKQIKRIETSIYEYDFDDIDLAKNIGMIHEITKKNELFNWGRFWNINIYSLVSDEIYSLRKR